LATTIWSATNWRRRIDLLPRSTGPYRSGEAAYQSQGEAFVEKLTNLGLIWILLYNHHLVILLYYHHSLSQACATTQRGAEN
jgi:hypothetical protein